jgi:hypothetical protein
MACGAALAGCTTTARAPADQDGAPPDDAATAGEAAGDPDVTTGEDVTTVLPPDASGPDEEEPPIAFTYVRIANWSPDSPAPGIDLCVAPHGSSAFQGPLFADYATSTDAGGAFAVPFPLATAYLAIPPGRYDVRVVASGPGGCAAPIGPDAADLASLPSYAYTTLAVLGDTEPTGADPSLAVVELDDDQSLSGYAALRFVNAAPSVAAADFGTGALADGDFSVLFSGVPFGRAGTQEDSEIGTVDANGYLFVAQRLDAAVSARASAASMTDLATARNISLLSASALTFALVGAKTGGAPARLVQCSDNQAVPGWLDDCGLISP